ncbi:hypothetical protein HZC07_05580 [Candidatus Micrarchaeota archaeon]|nr:hypothetical protein [Candidatus Micrarchaeota archaeon]
MFKQLLAFILITTILFSNSVTLKGDLDRTGLSSMQIGLDLPSSEGQTVFISVPGMPSTITVKDKSGLELPYSIKQENDSTMIYVIVPVDYVEFSILSDSFTIKENSQWTFNFTLGASKPIDVFSGSLKLPEGSVVKSTNGAIKESDGQLLLTWSASNLSTSQKLRLRSSYELQSVASEPVYLFPVLLFVLILITVFFILRKNSDKKSEKISTPSTSKIASSLESNSVFKTLDETDKEILREISSKGGKTTQATIYLNTHIPKATLSRRIVSLQNRGILISSQKGNRNLITLTELLK